MSAHVQEREARLQPVVLIIFGCSVAIMIGAYLLGQMF